MSHTSTAGTHTHVQLTNQKKHYIQIVTTEPNADGIFGIKNLQDYYSVYKVYALNL